MRRSRSRHHMAWFVLALCSTTATSWAGVARVHSGSAASQANLSSASPAAGGAGVSDAELSFGEALALLTKRNHELQAAAKGLRLPRLQASARWTRIDEPITIDLEPIRGAMLALHPTVPPEAVPPFVADIQDDRFFKAQMELTWPVYTGGKIAAANRAAAARVEDARQQGRGTEQNLIAELAHRYYGLRLAEQARAVRQSVFNGMKQHLFQARRMEEEGLIARAERLHAEVAHAEASRALQAADQDVALATAALRSLLESDRDVRPTSDLFVVHSLPPLDELQRLASEGNPDLKRLAAQRELARQLVAVERSAYLPDVALFAVRELATADLTVLEPTWAAGLGVRMSVFDGLSRGHRVAAARAAENTIDHLEAGARAEIALLVESRYRELKKAVEQFDSLTATIVLAEENLRVRSSAFEEGFATSLDVVDARTTLAGARLSRLSAAYDFVTTLADLLATVGQGERFESYRQLADVEVNS